MDTSLPNPQAPGEPEIRGDPETFLQLHWPFLPSLLGFKIERKGLHQQQASCDTTRIPPKFLSGCIRPKSAHEKMDGDWFPRKSVAWTRHDHGIPKGSHSDLNEEG
jgi:hypothetical protein